MPDPSATRITPAFRKTLLTLDLMPTQYVCVGNKGTLCIERTTALAAGTQVYMFSRLPSHPTSAIASNN